MFPFLRKYVKTKWKSVKSSTPTVNFGLYSVSLFIWVLSKGMSIIHWVTESCFCSPALSATFYIFRNIWLEWIRNLIELYLFFVLYLPLKARKWIWFFKSIIKLLTFRLYLFSPGNCKCTQCHKLRYERSTFILSFKVVSPSGCVTPFQISTLCNI